MTQQSPEQTVAGVVPAREDLEQYTSYEDEGALVICDRENPAAWVQSDVTEPIRS